MTTIIAFVVVLGILILIHEFGHFLMARVAGVGVERFSIGFGPVLWRVRGKETEYCLSLFPLGGYVKMMGDDENPLESGGTGVVDPARAFNHKPLFVRFLIVFAGPGMNWVLAAVIFSLVFMILGRPMMSPVVGRVTDGGPAQRAGLLTGDRVVAVDGRPIRHWEEVLHAAQDARAKGLALTVRRGDAERSVQIMPERTKAKDILGDERELWEVGARSLVPAVVGEVVMGFPAAQAGLQGGDRVRAIEGQPVQTWEDMAEMISRRPGQSTRIEIERGSTVLTIPVVPSTIKERHADGRETEVGRIGISPAAAGDFIRSGPVMAVWEGIARTGEVTAYVGLGLWKIATGQLDRKNIGGPIQIAVSAGEQARQGLPSLAFFTAVISINLFVLNLLPVPMLDGGHLLFFVCEAVLGRPLSVRKREVAQQVGFVLLMLLMVYAVYNDLERIGLFRFLR